MKSRRILLVGITACTLSLSSCSLFRQVKTETAKTSTAEQSSSSQSSLFVDTGTVVTTRHWSFGKPVLENDELPRFKPKDPPAAGSSEADYRNAFLDLRAQYQQLLELTKNGWATMTERTTEAKGQSLASSTDLKKESLASTADQRTEKKPDTNFLLITGGVFAAGLIVVFIYLACISRKLNNHMKVYEKLNRNLPSGE